MFTNFNFFKAFEGKEPDKEDKNFLIQSLYDAIDNNNLTKVQILIECYKIDCNIKYGIGELTPLLSAIWSGSLQICRYLSSYEFIDINKSDGLLNTPLQTSIIVPIKNNWVFNCIVGHNSCDINHKNDSGDSALHLAIKERTSSDEQSKLLEIIYKLLEHKNLEVEAVDADKRNILHISCLNSDVEVVKLIMKKVDISKLICMKDSDNKRPIHYCNNNPRLYELLKLAEFMPNKPIYSDQKVSIEYEF
jgi:ankyrin repeat protein